jgi:hypothetical protein
MARIAREAGRYLGSSGRCGVLDGSHSARGRQDSSAFSLESNSTSGGSAGAKLSVPDTLNPLRQAAGAIALQGIAGALAHAVGEDPEAEMSLRQSDLDRASRGQLIDAMRHAQGFCKDMRPRATKMNQMLGPDASPYTPFKCLVVNVICPV